MKTASSFVLICALLFLPRIARANPIIARYFTELQCDSTGWKLEMHPSFPVLLDGWYLETTSGRAYFKNGISIDTGYVIITSDSMLTPLFINPLGDMLSMGDSASTWASLRFGSGGEIAAPHPGQSLCVVPNISDYFWYLDNTPTLGGPNDYTNATGILHGRVTNRFGLPVRQVLVHYRGWLPPNVATTDSAGFFQLSYLATVEALYFVHPEYQPLWQSVQLWPDSTLTMDFVLQGDSLVDVFPLAIGNQWIYRYYTNFTLNSGWGLQITIDSGLARYDVSGVLADQDSIRWTMTEHRDLLHRFEDHGFNRDTAYTVSDSSTFELIESTNGQHQLYVNGEYVHRHVFFFTRTFTDTTSVVRFRSVDSTGTITFESKEPGTLPPPFYSRFTFGRAVGMQEVDYMGGFIDASFDANHQLLNYVITSVRERQVVPRPTSPELSQNFPNPFNPVTSFKFHVSPQKDGGQEGSKFVQLKVYDVLGREVATLVNEMKQPGTYEVTWDARDQASGVYFCRMTSSGFSQTRKVLLIR